MSGLSPGSANVYQDIFPVRLEFKQNWSDSWSTLTGIEPIRANISTGLQDAGSLTFRRRFGKIKFHDTSTIANQARANIDNWWVRVLASPYANDDIMWLGKVRAENRDLYNRQGINPDAGVQIYTAYDGIDILRKRSISTSYFETSLNTFTELRRMPGMNWPSDQNMINANKTTRKRTANGTSFHCFYGIETLTKSLTEGGSPEVAAWKVDEFLEYIIGNFLNNTSDSDEPTWSLSIPQVASESILTDVNHSTPFNDFENALSMIQKVLPKKYGFDFVVRPATDDSGYVISVHTLTSQDVTTGGKTLAANPNQVSINLTSSVDSENKVMEISHTEQYGTIRIIGDPIVICGTYKVNESEVEADWESVTETTYKAGTGTSSDSAAEHDDARRLIEDVYSDFKITQTIANWPAKHRPTVDDDGSLNFTTETPIQFLDRQTLDWLPIYDGGDYTSSPPDLSETTWKLTKPFVIVERDDTPGLTKLTNEQANLELSVHDYQLGVSVRGEINHEIALHEFTSAEDTEIGAIYQYENMQVTIAWEHDERLMITSKLSGVSAVADSTLDLYEKGQTAWVLAPSTTLGLDKDGAVISSPSSPVELRNDIDVLKQVMNGAKARYQVQRARARFRIAGLLEWTSLLGQILKAVTDNPAEDIVNAPITSIEWSFEKKYTTSFATGFAQQ